MKASSPILARQYLYLGIKMFFSALLVLCTVDVAVNLRLVQEVSRGHPFHSRTLDYLSLILMDSQIAFGAAIVCLFGGALAAFLSRRLDASRESIAMLSAALSAIVMLSETYLLWGLSKPNIIRGILVSIAIGAFLWSILRYVLEKRVVRQLGFSDMIQYALFPALFVGFGNLILRLASRSAWADVAIDCIPVLLLLVSLLLLYRSKSTIWRAVFRWLPVWALLPIIAYSIISSSFYGKSHERTSTESVRGRPHIILIILDTVRADHMECYGYSRNTMPNLESWSKDALIARRAVSPAGWTPPAHASIFSGRTVSLHGIHSGFGEWPFYTRAFENIAWLPEQLAKEGYYCLAVTANSMAIPPDVTGFKRVLNPMHTRWTFSTMGALADRLSPLSQRFSERTRWRMPYLDARQIVDVVIRALPEGDGPVFLFVNFLDAHAPYNPPVRALRRLGVAPGHTFSRYIQYPKLNRIWDSLPESKTPDLIDLYDGEMHWLDSQLNRLLLWIDERLGKESVVIVSSDHGEELGEEGRIGHYYGLHQSILHVPLFVRGPDLPIGDLEQIVTLRNLYDFIHLLGMGRKPGIETLTQIDDYGMISERYPNGRHIRVFGPEYGRHWISLFEGDYKAVGPSEYGFQFFEVRESGFDQEVEVANPPCAAALRERIDSYWRENRDPREEMYEYEARDEKDLKKLRSLGYIK